MSNGEASERYRTHAKGRLKGKEGVDVEGRRRDTQAYRDSGGPSRRTPFRRQCASPHVDIIPSSCSPSSGAWESTAAHSVPALHNGYSAQLIL